MPGFLFHVDATANCPHGGQVSVEKSKHARVLVSGHPVATLSDKYPVKNCGFTVPPGKPQPCVKVQWLLPASRVLVSNKPVILQSSTGISQSAEQIPQGPPTVIATQTRVRGI